MKKKEGIKAQELLGELAELLGDSDEDAANQKSVECAIKFIETVNPSYEWNWLHRLSPVEVLPTGDVALTWRNKHGICTLSFGVDNTVFCTAYYNDGMRSAEILSVDNPRFINSQEWPPTLINGVK
jgi:hypothetical protein